MKWGFIILLVILAFLLLRQTSGFYGPKMAGERCETGDECYHTCAGGRCN